LIQDNRLSRLTDAEPGLSHLSSSLSDQPKHAARGAAVPPANLGAAHFLVYDQPKAVAHRVAAGGHRVAAFLSA
jgi:hypothetical protein